MALTMQRSMYYTICRKPTIRQKKGESDEEFYARMTEWYDDDADSKIRLVLIDRTDEEVDEFIRSFKNIRDDILMAKRYNDFYRNSCHCNAWGRRCEYSSICMHYDPNQEYIGFVRREQDAGTVGC